MLLEGRDLVKLGWEIMDRTFEMQSLREWEEGCLGRSASLDSQNWARLGWIELEWCVGLGCWDRKCFKRRLQAKEATSATKWK